MVLSSQENDITNNILKLKIVIIWLDKQNCDILNE